MSMCIRMVSAGIALAIACTSTVTAADNRGPTTPQHHVILPQTEQVTVTGGPERDRPYRLLISEPDTREAPEEGFPVLFVLDGNAYFGSFHEAKRVQKEYSDTIVVGVGYPTDEPHDYHRRSYDFSPPAPESRNEPPQGGDDDFLDTLEKRIIPAIDERYEIDRNRLSIFGHSFGGMFVMHALFTRPHIFANYVAASPSLWWKNDYLLAEERAFAGRVRNERIDVADKSVYLIAGERESRQTIQDARAQWHRLRPLSQWGLRSAFTIRKGENHMSLPVGIATLTLRQVFTTRQF
jgi:predicted alpha/beta superfamily hydrolase